MAGKITHEWNGTTLIVTSDSGTSSADLKGDKGDMGVRGAQGAAGNGDGVDMSEYYTKSEIDAMFAALNGGGNNDAPNGTTTTINIHSSWTNFSRTYDGDVVVEWGYNNDAGGAGDLFFNDELVYSGGVYTLAGLSASADGSVTGANDIPAERSAILKAGYVYDFYMYGEQENDYGGTEQGGGIDGTVTITANHLHQYQKTSNGDNTHTFTCLSCDKQITSACVDINGYCSVCGEAIT